MKTGIKDYTFIFVNAIVALLLAVFYTLMASYFLPEGVNWVFVERLWKRLFLAVPFIICGLTIYLYIFNNKRITYSKAYERVNRHDYIFAVIPMIPVFRYVLANHDWLSFLNSALVLLFFFMLSILICVVIPSFLSLFAIKHILMAVSTSLLFIVISMASLSAHYSWMQEGDLFIQSAVLVVIFVVIAFSALLPRQLIALVIGLVFLANMVMAYTEIHNNKENAHAEIEDLTIYRKLSGREILRDNDILLLVYEAYANYETVLHYGYDNSEQLAFLEDKGFHIYHSVYSVDTPTTSSMSRVFNLDTAQVDRKYPAGGGAVQTLLREAGYESHSIFQDDYFFRNLNHDQLVCNNPFPPLHNEAQTMINAIIRGAFSDELVFEGVGYEAYVEKKHAILKRNNQPPLFMYTHSNFPGHGPSGMGVDPEESPKYMEWYTNNALQIANKEMMDDIVLILGNNPEAIVIIAGDHGPFLTKDGYGLNRRGNFATKDIDRYDIQDRFGAFLAIRWPDHEYAKTHNIVILQDIFPAVFAYLYDDDSLFNELRMEQVILNSDRILGVTVKDGIIGGGKNDGEPLFLYNQDGN